MKPEEMTTKELLDEAEFSCGCDVVGGDGTPVHDVMVDDEACLYPEMYRRLRLLYTRHRPPRTEWRDLRMPSDWTRELWEKLQDVTANEEAWEIIEEAGRELVRVVRERVVEDESGGSDRESHQGPQSEDGA